ncbi:MAG: asparagine--tRNA ligase [archaeon GB-1867-005]|nr:asparagine--tRNA ligase [Candidatus Culexmicrobium cathedralense]
MSEVEKLEEIRGWIFKKREHGKIIFFDLRNALGITQCVIKKGVASDEAWSLAKKASQESSVILKGFWRKEPRAPRGVEFIVKELNIVHMAETPWPLGKKSHSPETLMEYRHLAVRGARYQAIFKIRHEVLRSSREYFVENGWYEVSPPIIVATACEGGATLFKMKYFENEAYLTQSSQLYLEVMIFSLEKVWCLAPSFRAEKSRTRRHLCEFWHLEAEAAWMDLEGLMKLEEELVSHICNSVADNCTKELELLGRDPDFLRSIKPPFERITYDEAINRLQKMGKEIRWGEDIGGDEEKLLTMNLTKPIFMYGYPLHLKAFYVKEDPKRPGIGLTVDLLAPEGYGEMATGGVREDDINKLIARIKAEGFDLSEYSWYLDLRRYGSVPHAGFGIGIDRLTWWICKLDHVRDTLPFPRLARTKKFI